MPLLLMSQKMRGRGQRVTCGNEPDHCQECHKYARRKYDPTESLDPWSTDAHWRTQPDARWCIHALSIPPAGGMSTANPSLRKSSTPQGAPVSEAGRQMTFENAKRAPDAHQPVDWDLFSSALSHD